MNTSFPHAPTCHQPAGDPTHPMFVADDFVHDLRQPLSVIDAVAYYLELTCKDKNASSHLQQIQAMVREANRIVAQVSKPQNACQA